MKTLNECSLSRTIYIKTKDLKSTKEYFIPLLAMLAPNFFFSLAANVGFEYAGIKNSNALLLYSVLVFILNGALYIKSVLWNGGRLSIIDVSLILVLGVFIMSYLLPSLSRGRLNSLATFFLRDFVAFTLHSTLAAICVSKMRAFSGMTSLLEVVMLVLSLSIILRIILPYF